MVKVETLGAGGGSICHVHNGVVAVGPASAGSEPGPICYGSGGTQPTVTDALLMLGILSVDATFAGGSMQLTDAGVKEAFGAIGEQMGYSAEEAAFDCWRVVNANMSQAVRRTVAEKGIASEDMVMMAYGGNGPVFAAIQADALNIDRVLVPRASPTFSALGTLVASPSIDEERSYIAPADRPQLDTLKQLWQTLDERAEQYFTEAHFPREQVTARYQINMRYPGQNGSLTLDIQTNRGPRDLSFVDDNLPNRAIDAFNQRHMAEFGHIREDELPEITGVRLATSVETPSPAVVAGFDAPTVAAQPAGHRRANLGEGFADTAIYQGSGLRPGHEVAGPAIIEETFTTIVVYPGWTARLDDAGDYELSRN